MMTKSVKERRVSVKTLALTAMFAALVTVSTAFIKVPAPLGYAHAGDAIVYLAACLLPPPFGFFAAGIGGATADLLSGYAVFALPTAIIKSLNVLPFFLVRIFLKKKQKDDKILSLILIPALILTSFITVGGYFIVNTILFNEAYAITETPFNVMQAIVCAVLFTALGAALDSVKLKKKLI